MFRVPSNPDNPTFDDTFKVGILKWLTSSKKERHEWALRRTAAASAAQQGQAQRLDTWAERKRAEHS